MKSDVMKLCQFESLMAPLVQVGPRLPIYLWWIQKHLVPESELCLKWSHLIKKTMTGGFPALLAGQFNIGSVSGSGVLCLTNLSDELVALGGGPSKLK